MILKRQLKTLFFHFLELFPTKVGDAVYHFTQRRFENVDLSYKFHSTSQSYLSLKRVLKESKIKLRSKKIIEIGSGWLPLMPYFMLFEDKAEGVDTYDLNEHFNPKEIIKLNNFFTENTPHTIEGLSENYNLPDKIKYFPKTDLTNSDLTGIDLVFSRFVLEHVSRWEIERMHNYFKQNLKPGSHIIHFISPSDHRAYDNASLSLQDFLQYSEEEWNRRQTRFDYHNRLRLPQYIYLFHKLGFEIVHLEYDCPAKNSEIYKKFEAVPLHKDFMEFTEEELTAGSINIVLKV